ncbi:YbdD/YjiX family protein [Polymorphobacter sp.]|uniref:YbdD/YjiX family protein n=1 Tax=Polymorphobacter sp. TaxID=1909290 RepID=UPI003F6FEDA8
MSGTGLRRAWQLAQDMARLAVGIPSYNTYVDHIRHKHPDREPMTQAEFFRERQAARYTGGSGRCC